MALTVGRVPCFDFFILNELINEHKNSVIAWKSWTLNVAAWKKFDGSVNGQSTTSTPSKFDTAISSRKSTAEGSSA